MGPADRGPPGGQATDPKAGKLAHRELSSAGIAESKKGVGVLTVFTIDRERHRLQARTSPVKFTESRASACPSTDALGQIRTLAEAPGMRPSWTLANEASVSLLQEWGIITAST